MLESIYYVYAHKRLDTNEIFYIGKGKGNRLINRAGRNKWWKAVVNKVGFSAEIVRENLTEQQALDFEQASILFFRELGHKLCNITEGGDKGNTGRKASAETRAKMSASQTGKKRSPMSKEARMRIGDAQRGKKRKPHSEETKTKIGNAHRGVKKAACSDALKAKLKAASHGKKVQCSNGMLFDSVADAARWLTTDTDSPSIFLSKKKSISMCCNGSRPSAYSYSWSFSTN